MSPNPHADLARACLAFLSFDDFSNKAPDCWLRWQHEDIFRSAQELACSPYHFTCYAALLWGVHVQRGGEIELLKEILDFLSRPANVAYNWLVTMAPEWVELWKRVLYEELSLRDSEFLKMLLVVKLGLKFVLVELLKKRTKPAENALDPVISGLACDAAGRGYKEIVRLLLTQEDVDWNMCWIHGRNLLMLLADRNDEENLRTLLEMKSCSVNTTTDSESALQRAVGWGYTSITRLLLEAGANVKPRGHYGWSIISPAMRANVLESWREMMDLLLEYKADINAHGWHGTTALHSAATFHLHSTYIVQYLVSKNANVNLPNEQGETPLDLAKSAAEERINPEGGGTTIVKDNVERATQIIPILQKAGGKTAKEMLQPSIGEEDPCFPPEWLDRLGEIKEWRLVYESRLNDISPCRCGKRKITKNHIAVITLLSNAYQRHSSPSSVPSSSLVDTEKWKSKISIHYLDHSDC